jgi:holliday junction DNA helicase RuvA
MKAIQFEDDKILSSVPGIGKKTAQKIIVDLKGSINFAKASDTIQAHSLKHPNNTLVVSSLVQMGYDKTRVEEIIETLGSDLPLADKVREAIKKLK